MSRYFVNPAHSAQGPFEESQVIALIRAGKLSTGVICKLGEQVWMPLGSHRPFAQALREAGHVVTDTTQNPRFGVLSGGRKAPPRKLVMAAVLSFFGFAMAAVAIGTYVMFGTGATRARSAFPVDTQAFLEFVNLRSSATQLSHVRFLAKAKLDDQRVAEDLTLDLVDSFGIAKANAQALLLAATSFGVGARHLDGTPQAGAALTFASAGPVNALLNSKRFTFAGLVAKSGRKYRLVAAPAAPASLRISRRLLASANLDASADPHQDPTQLVWFETTKVLFLGSGNLANEVARVLALDSPSLEQNRSFQAALRELPAQASAIAFADGSTWFGAKPAANAPPRVTSASLRIVDAGLLVQSVSHVPSVTPAPRVLVDPPQALDVSRYLPAETVAYLALATHTGLSGAEVHARLLGQLRELDPQWAARAEAGSNALAQSTGVDLDQMLDSVGDQGAIAVLLPADYALTVQNPTQIFGTLAVVYLQALKDEAKTRALLQTLSRSGGPLATIASVHADPDGFTVTPTEALLAGGLSAHVFKGFLLVAIGPDALCARAEHALASGEQTLSTDAAEHAARAALPQTALGAAWIDVGRAGLLAAHIPFLGPRLVAAGLDPEQVQLSGPERLTAALTINATANSDATSYRVDSLNLPAVAGFGGFFLLARD